MNSGYGSHVMQYGDLKLSKEHISLYMGTNPANDNYTYVDDNFLWPPAKAVNQRDADLLHFWDKVCAQPSSVPVSHRFRAFPIFYCFKVLKEVSNKRVCATGRAS